MRGFTKLAVKHKKNDAYLDIYISSAHMEARADFYPARDGGRPFTKEYLDLVLKKTGICYGVEYKTIDDTADECNDTGAAVYDVIIARGFIPIDDSPAYFKINEELTKPPAPKILPDGRVDYRAATPFIMVKEGDCLARMLAATPGHNGKTIYGVDVPFKKVQRRELIEGEGIYIQNDRIYAKTAGRLKIEGSTISVEHTLRLGAVDYTTGDIDFTGELVLEGAVSDGFKVHSGGNITALDTFAVSDCFSRGSIHAHRGVIGRGNSTVKANGVFRAAFVRNCNLVCKGNVYIEKEIIGSTVWTMGMLDIYAGTVAGSTVYALRGIRAANIGTRSAKPARIYLGADWTLERQMKKDAQTLRLLKMNIDALAGAVSQCSSGESGLPVSIPWHTAKGVHIRLAANTPPFAEECAQLRDKLAAEYKAVYSRYAENSKKKQTDYDAALTVYGNIAAGTYIEICSVPYFVKDTMHDTRFALDKKTKQVCAFAAKGIL
ncbi:MAG: FapA family protein [Spirochaetaceae bacterium]|jgi:uncharacterized protein (DUF342 family)|nr:FapA family protein [Spirochaetaceae bacterium]